MSTLRGFLDIRPGERRNTFAAFATLLAITTGHTLLETARDAFFLAKMPASRLPWMYLVIVAIALVLSQIKAARADSKLGVAGSLVVAAGITTGFWTLLVGGAPTHTVLYALYVWTGLFGSWAMVQVWTLLGRAHTMTQAKRLYGFIGAGAVLGGVVGAVLARLSISMMSPRSAVLLAAGIFVLAAVPCVIIVLPADEAPAKPRARGQDAEAPRRPMSATIGLLWENVVRAARARHRARLDHHGDDRGLPLQVAGRPRDQGHAAPRQLPLHVLRDHERARAPRAALHRAMGVPPRRRAASAVLLPGLDAGRRGRRPRLGRSRSSRPSS